MRFANTSVALTDLMVQLQRWAAPRRFSSLSLAALHCIAATGLCRRGQQEACKQQAHPVARGRWPTLLVILSAPRSQVVQALGSCLAVRARKDLYAS